MTIITVDTDGISGNYASGGAALAALPDPWIDDYIITLDASTGVLDTSSLDIPNGVDTAGHSISVEAATGNEASKDGIDTLKYRNGGVQARIRNVVDGAYKNIQFVEGSNFGAMVQLVGLVAGSRAEVSGCFLKSGASTRSNQGIFVNDVDCDAVIFNNIIANPEVNMQRGVIVTNCNTALIYNNVVEGCSINGIELTAGTITVKNNASFNNATNDILDNASSIIDFNLSDDGTGNNPQTPSGGDIDNEFVNSANDDFTAVETGNIQNGVGPSVDVNVPTLDIEGDTRSGATAFIGVDEPTGVIPVSPNDLILSSIILEQTKATPTIIADNLVLSAIILESPIVSAIVSPDNLILSAIILEQTSIGGTISPDDLILSSIILESPGVSGTISPDNLVLSAIILEQATIIPAVVPNNLVLSAIILGQTRETVINIINSLFVPCNIQRSININCDIETKININCDIIRKIDIRCDI